MSRTVAAARVTPRRQRTALRATWLFDGTSATLRANPIVVFDGDTIVDVDYHVEPPADAHVIDLAGATLLPGLVDTHVHLAFDATADPVGSLAARDDDAALAAMTAAARTAARGGVTTVRDLGDRDYLASRLRDQPGLPTIVAAGPPITPPGGHCHFLGGVATPGPDGIRAAVREHAERGAQVIKVMASGGLMTPGTREDQSQFTPDELRAAADEAHRLGLSITAHAHGTRAILDAVAAGYDGVEHASFWTRDGVEQPPESIVAEIVARRIAIGATAGFAPANVELEPAAAQRMPLIVANMLRLLNAGALLLPATDAGVHPLKPHDALRYAVPQLAALGMAPLHALQTATSIGAEVCGLGHRKGRLAPGYDADILAIDGDPLTEPEAMHRIRRVYLRGVEPS